MKIPAVCKRPAPIPSLILPANPNIKKALLYNHINETIVLQAVYFVYQYKAYTRKYMEKNTNSQSQ